MGNALSLEILLEQHGRDTQQDEESPQNSNNKSKTRLSKKRINAIIKDKRKHKAQCLVMNNRDNKREWKKWMNIVI